MKTKPTVARKLLIILFTAIALVIGTHLLVQYLNLQVFQEKNGFVFELSNRLDMDDEISIPTWFSAMLFTAVGITALVAAYLEPAKAKRRLWALIGCIGIAMSLDETASSHEFVLQSLHNIFFLDALPQVSRNAWWLVAPLLVALAAGLAWYSWRQLPKRTFVLFMLGGSVLLGGAVIIDVIASVTTASLYMRQGVLVAIEEGCELTGTAIILYAIVNHIERTYGPALSRAKRQLRHSKS